MNREEFLELCQPIAELVHSKGEDYNQGMTQDMYFPFAHKSYVQMIFIKTMRLVSLLLKPGAPKHESIEDTVKDLIAYCIFYIKFLKEEANAGK
jgi:hypothetical protein